MAADDRSTMSAWVAQLRRGLVELCVLAILNAGEAYGYEIVDKLNDEANLDVSESTVYPILARLHRDKQLAQRKVASSTGPPRRYFQLTEAGRRRFEEMTKEWESLNASVRQLVKKGL